MLFITTNQDLLWGELYLFFSQEWSRRDGGWAPLPQVILKVVWFNGENIHYSRHPEPDCVSSNSTNLTYVGQNFCFLIFEEDNSSIGSFVHPISTSGIWQRSVYSTYSVQLGLKTFKWRERAQSLCYRLSGEDWPSQTWNPAASPSCHSCGSLSSPLE